MKTIGISYDDLDDIPLDHINGYMEVMNSDKEKKDLKKSERKKNQVPPKTDWSWINK